MGMFTEVRNSVRMGIPATGKCEYLIKVNKGKIYCSLSDSSKACFSFYLAKGDLYLNVNSNEYQMQGDSLKLVNTSGKTVHWINPVLKHESFQIIRFELAKGKVYLQ